MKAEQIMNYGTEWITWGRTMEDCDYAICFTTDNADWWDSDVLDEDTLDAGNFVEEVMK